MPQCNATLFFSLSMVTKRDVRCCLMAGLSHVIRSGQLFPLVDCAFSADSHFVVDFELLRYVHSLI